MMRAALIGFNFRRLRERAGLTPRKAAEMGDVNVNYIYQVQGGKVAFGRDAQEKWAPIFQCSLADFFKDPDQVVPADLPGHKVPLISWVQAGSLHEPVDMYQPGFAEEWITTDAHGPNVFALRVVGDSMCPEYLAGDIIIIDPALEPMSGDDAIIKVDGEVTFKRIHFSLNNIILSPVNGDYKPMQFTRDDNIDIRVIGKVVQLIRKK